MDDPVSVLGAWLLSVVSLTTCAHLAQRITGDNADWLVMTCAFLALNYQVPAICEILGLAFGVDTYPSLHPGRASDPRTGILLAASSACLTLGYFVVAGRCRTRSCKSGPSTAWMWIAALAMVLTVGLWSISFGGLIKAITSIHEIRAGRQTPESIPGWLLNLSKASWTLLAIALWSLITARRWDRRVAAPLLLAVLAGTMMLLRGGRGAFVNALLLTTILAARSTSVRPARQMAVVVVFVVLAGAIGLGLKPASNYLNYRGQGLVHDQALDEALTQLSGSSNGTGVSGMISALVSEYSHFPIVATLSIEHAQSASFDPDGGRDAAMALGKLLPAFVFEPSGEPLAVKSTLLISGVDTANVPPGFLGWCILSFGLPALPVTAVAAGALLGVSRLLGIVLKRALAIGDLIPLTLGLTFASGIAAGTPGETLREATILVVVLGMISVLARLGSRRKRAAAGMHPGLHP